MACYAYLFEVRSIQPYLFATGRLKDMVAGSELIDFLCTQPLDAALRACELDSSDLPCPRRAGGAFYLLLPDGDRARRLSLLWPLLVDQLLPGIEQVDALVQGETARQAIQRGLDKLREARNRPRSILPVPGPLSLRSPRTGEVAIGHDRGEDLDAATFNKRLFRRKAGGLTSRFGGPDLIWPNNFEKDAPEERRFPLNQDRLVGLIHADGNGLGEILRILNDSAAAAGDERYVQIYRCFSEELERATCRAAQDATERVLLPQRDQYSNAVPARPLVLGGDDLTLIVRADLALAFTEQFIVSFEHHSQQMLRQLQGYMREAQLDDKVTAQMPDRLTACAGITYLKATQPFAQAYSLAESLCARAKGAARLARRHQGGIVPSAVAFHRVRATLIEDAEELFERELLIRNERGEWGLSLSAYRVGQVAAPMPNLKDLRNLVDCFGGGKLNDKPLRSLATLLHGRLDMAEQDYRRWRTVTRRNGSGKGALERYDQALARLLGASPGDELPFGEVGRDGRRQGPLMDLLDLLALEKKNAAISVAAIAPAIPDQV